MKPTVKSPVREVNKRILLSIHQDGLFDILGGLIVVNFGWVPILDATGLNPGVRQLILLSFYALSMVLILWLKRRISTPRAGYVKLTKKTASRLAVIMLIVNMVLFLIFAGVYVLDLPWWAYLGSYQMSIPLGLIFLVLFSFSGSLLKAARFHLYGILVFAAYIGSEHLYVKGVNVHHGITLAAFASGGIILFSGILILLKFIRMYSAD
jgi:hypothetical protein